MKTSQQWWNEVKADPELLKDWLVKQYRGEVTASHRILKFAEQYADKKHLAVLHLIAEQEQRHAKWVQGLLESRGVVVNQDDIDQAEKRYWKEMLPGIDSFETGSAVAAHAENMRLERIRVICEDPETPVDIRSVFRAIFPEEEFHERAFSKMATPEAMTQMQHRQELGLQALGLEA